MAVTKTNNLKRGMKDANGSTDIADLQTALNATGKYNLDVDGSFGPATEAAVIDYQKNTPGLVVDGVVGTNTWGKLTATPPATAIKPTTATKPTATTKPAVTTNTTTTTKPSTSSKPAATTKPATKPATTVPKADNAFTTPAGNTYEEFTYDPFTYDPLVYSDAVNEAFATLAELNANAPGSWADPYAEQRKGYLDEYENRDPFNYDFNSDALYQQYKDQYVQQGQMAMMDTMGQAAAMTGGYGNSYAQSVGQQAYQGYLQQLNDKIPELYDRAYGIYQQEGQDLLNMYDLYTGLSSESYNQYLGEVDRHYKELDAAANYAQTLRENERADYLTGLETAFNIWNTDTNLDFNTWAAKNGILSDENATIMNQKFQEKLNQINLDESNKSGEKSDLINLITATGYKPTDAELKAAGMTREQADGYAKAYTDSKTTVTAPVKYTELSTSEQDWWEKKLRNCNTPEAVVEIGKQMDARGYNPNLVDSIVNSYMAQFEDEEDDGFWDKVSNWWQGVTK